MQSPRIFAGTLLALTACAPVLRSAEATRIEFNRDIRPILSENCFYCHGQDTRHREADLRLDLAEEATRDLGGYAAIVPGQPERSELLTRLTSHDRDEVMPPRKANKHVTPEQIAVLHRWIAEGAPYQKHWAFIPPQRAALPEVKASGWPRNPVDRFVLARLEGEGLKPAPDARPETWLRRASFDLTGLPPTPAALDAFAAAVASRGESAYAVEVARLLASTAFGERQAIDWLDTARYADTHGFNNDTGRTMWRWRDWVIDAFNTNLPYDRFITEQLAGDLLPRPTLEQRIATGFGRNHVINSEGGIIEEEYRVEYVADRVRTMSLAWVGLTVECARCHDHKFDPISQRDYYRFFAFFNQVPELGEDGRVHNAVPMMPAPTREQQATLAEQARRVDAIDKELRIARDAWQWRAESRVAIEDLAQAACDSSPTRSGAGLLENETSADGVVGGAWLAEATKPAPKIDGKKLDFAAKDGVTLALWLQPAVDNSRDVALISSLDHLGSPADAGFGRGQELRLIDGELELRISSRFPGYSVRVVSEGAGIQASAWRHVVVSYAGGRRAADVCIFVDGEELATRVLNDGLHDFSSSKSFLLGADNARDGLRWRGVMDEARSFPRVLRSSEVRALFAAEGLPYALARTKRGDAGETERAWLRAALVVDATRAGLWEEHLALRRSLPTSMVMEELTPARPSFVLNRGQYDAHGEAVDAGVPEQLLAPWPKDAPRNRLGLAQWLIRPDHPLTARVVVNRFWAQLFGTGLVKTVEDFGFQSEWPSHPELLDWLAREFVDGGWNVQALFKTFVLSATYRQDSAVTPALMARDPENRLLARGPRLRLPAELIRDQALAISGLLRPRIGGPSVFPYQPEKLYDGIVVGTQYPGSRWGQSSGDDLYRRSLYTFWKRTVPHPAMVSFDAPDREVCTARRTRTNTPLQALLLLNEPGYLESARQLAARMLREGGADDAARTAFAFRLATGRAPRAEETRVLSGTLTHFRNEFASDPQGAAGLLKVGASPVDPNLPAPELAAATVVASMILNLDETITKN